MGWSRHQVQARPFREASVSLVAQKLSELFSEEAAPEIFKPKASSSTRAHPAGNAATGRAGVTIPHSCALGLLFISGPACAIAAICTHRRCTAAVCKPHNDFAVSPTALKSTLLSFIARMIVVGISHCPAAARKGNGSEVVVGRSY
jgi:hypothetical protein